jgi:hypothetical protein
MKEFKGTKGDWSIRQNIPYDTGGWVVYSGLGEYNKTICRLPYGNKIPQPKDQGFLENEANAKLIAAAPDLLEALQEMVLVFDRDDNDNAQHIRVGNAEAAIEKALN